MYDESITEYMRHQFTTNNKRHLSLRYGTNPHQNLNAELYSIEGDMPIKGKLKKFIFLNIIINNLIKNYSFKRCTQLH